MTTIQLHNDISDSFTCISNRFIDELLPEANGEFVKVYLYLLRSLTDHSENCTICGIADHLNYTEKDIVRALKYWEKNNVLGLDYTADRKSLTGIHILDLNPSVSSAEARMVPQEPATAAEKDLSEPAPRQKKAASGRKTASKASSKPARREYTLDEITAFQMDDAVTELFYIIETYLKHPLNNTDTNTLLYWYDKLHFPNDLIIYLVEYCISKGHSSFRYMDKVAIAWHEEGIRTVEAAKENTAVHSQAYYAVIKAFGIAGRNLGDSENAFVKKWTADYSLDLDLITEACRRTISAIHQPSFEYADRILMSWHTNRIHTLDDVKALDASRAKSRPVPAKKATTGNKFTNVGQRDYDYDQLEKILLTTSVQ